MGHQKK